jgi:transposase
LFSRRAAPELLQESLPGGLRQAAIEARIVDPKRVRSFALSAGRLAKNDAMAAADVQLDCGTKTATPSYLI